MKFNGMIAAVATAMLSLTTVGLYADGASCSSAKAASCTGAEKVAMKSGDCAAACAAKEDASMTKGGAAADNVASGYGIGQRVPNFTLSDTTGKSHNLTDFAGKVTVLVFYNQACPYVVEVDPRLNDFATKYADKGVVTVALDAGVNNSPEAIAKHAETRTFPILVDRSSDSARSFGASKTPEVFVIDKAGVVAYHGAFDSGAKGAKEGNLQSYAESAVSALLAGQEPEVRQTKAFGCSLKFADKGAGKSADKNNEKKAEKKAEEKPAPAAM